MRPQAKNSRKTGQNGYFSILLALLLLFVTIFGFCRALSPQNSLSQSLSKTLREVTGQDDAIRFLSSSLRAGSVSAKGEEKEVSFAGDLPEAASLTFGTGENAISLVSRGDKISLQCAALSDRGFSAARTGASDALSDSAFSDAGLDEDWMRFFRVYLALTEGENSSFGEVFPDWGKDLFDAGEMSLTVSSSGKEAEGEKGKTYCYQTESEGMKKILAAWKDGGKDGKIGNSGGALWSLISALSGEGASAEKKEAFSAFLSGSGDRFALWQKAWSEENARGEIVIVVSSGRVRKISWHFSGGGCGVQGEISFGKKPKKDGAFDLTLTVSEEEKDLLSVSFSHRISENSDSALIRRWEANLSDPTGVFLSEKTSLSAEATFSWGKQKGDLGLRLALDGREINFRGGSGEFKKGKELRFVLKRIEVDRKNRLEVPLTVVFTEKGTVLKTPRAEMDLFPQGEEREETARLLQETFSDLFIQES